MIAEKLALLEDTAVDVISVFGPWLGPVPSAYLVGVAAMKYLDWPFLIALIAAIAVESIGVVSVVSALRLYEWNETKRKSDPSAPFGLAVLLVVVYFVVTIGLTVLLDVIPELARFAPAVFPLLAAVGAVNIAVKNGQRRRETMVVELKQNAKPKVKVKHEIESETEAKTRVSVSPGVSARPLVEAALLADSSNSNASIGRSLGVTGQYVGQVRRELNGALKQ